MKTTVLTVTLTEKKMFQETELNFNNWNTNQFKNSSLRLVWSFGEVLHLIGAASDPQTELLMRKKVCLRHSPKGKICMYVRMYTLKFRKYFLNFNCEKRHVISQLNF